MLGNLASAVSIESVRVFGSVSALNNANGRSVLP